MNVSEPIIHKLVLSSWVKRNSTKLFKTPRKFNLLQITKQRLNRVEVDDPKRARIICKLIPAQCPFEREIKLLGRTLFYIPPLCKLNPLYEEVVALRFRALCFLADECGEDITAYC
ncbi:Mo-dependent nitrogenase C-terminal domain-containing protein [Lyngbya aestuarii]|uniref:Mo-dependent nitrogenase C-terminal domain-containing protein n=1 Tax=Lyngbya aestuarii TaxID=118322 RepID=UPI00403DDBD3